MIGGDRAFWKDAWKKVLSTNSREWKINDSISTLIFLEESAFFTSIWFQNSSILRKLLEFLDFVEIIFDF